MPEKHHSSIEDALNGTLGAVPKWASPSIDKPSIWSAIKLSVYFLVIFALCPTIISFLYNTNPNIELIQISIWGSAYLFFSSWTAKSTSSLIVNELRCIASALDANCQSEIEIYINKRYLGFQPDKIAIPIAIIGVFVSIISLSIDFGLIHYQFNMNNVNGSTFSIGPLKIVYLSSNIGNFEWAFFGSGFLILLYLAARCTYVLTIYLHIFRMINSSMIIDNYDPSNSILVRNMTEVSKKILAFWAGISISIASLPLLFQELDSFNRAIAGTTVFFSLVVGSAVYIIAEQHIRRISNKATTSKIDQINQRLDKLVRLVSAKSQQSHELEILKSHLEYLSEPKKTGSYIIVILSILMPIVGTAVGILVKWVE